MKVLVIGDMHLRAVSPVSRTDDISEAIESKFSQLLLLSHEVSAAVCLGDLFDSPTPPLSVVWQFLDFLDAFGKDFYVIPGNHDLYGYNYDTLYRTQVGHLARNGRIHLITDVATIGNRKFGNWLNCESCDVLLVHDFLLPFRFFGQETLIEEFVPPEGVKLVLVGHYHPGFDPVVVRGVTYVGVASLLRLEVGEADREVYVYLLDLDNLSLEKVPLVVSQGVFSQRIESRASVRTETVETLVDLDITSFDLPSIVKLVASSRGYSKEATEKLIRMVT